jgi:hypothetical protein
MEYQRLRRLVLTEAAHQDPVVGDDALPDRLLERQLMELLETYVEKHKKPPAELFIHGQTSFNDDEWRAFEEAVPPETNVVGVRIRTTGGETKLFRDGDYPVLRGTALILDDRNANLWTNG